MAVYTQSLAKARADIYYKRFQAAKVRLYDIIEKDPGNPDTWYWLGNIYLKEKKADSAKKILQDGIAFHEANKFSKKQYPLVFIGWAHLLLDNGAITESRIHMEEILKLGKFKDPNILLAVARAHIESKNGDIAWAIELLEKAAKKDKKNSEIFVATGDAYRKQINGSKAIINYDKAISIDPSYAEAYYKKGLIYKTQNNTEIFIERFSKAVTADSLYGPAIYELYYHYFYRDLKVAGNLLERYIRNSDPSIEHSYMMADYLFVSKKFQDAVSYANNIILNQGKSTKPRLYKLIAYSQAAIGDTVTAEKNMEKYFLFQPPDKIVAKDYTLMAKLTESIYEDKKKALDWYKKALSLESNQKDKLNYMISLAEIQKELGNREREAVWRENIYNSKEQPNNLDIYNWGVSLYMSENYLKADSVFELYSNKYPNQIYGHLWQARCNAIIDSTMEKGLAIPYYKKLIEITNSDKNNNSAIILKAYGYLGTYEANIKKDYTTSLYYFEKMLEIDPGNSDAQKYVSALKNWIETSEDSEPLKNN